MGLATPLKTGSLALVTKYEIMNPYARTRAPCAGSLENARFYIMHGRPSGKHAARPDICLSQEATLR